MGEYHPAEKKVIVEFSPEDFGLTEIQKMKLRKLAGPRYNPEKEVIKMSCESFEHQAQNKRYLAELVEKLVTEAKVWAHYFNELTHTLWKRVFAILSIYSDDFMGIRPSGSLWTFLLPMSLRGMRG